jgi:hypothetical protein
MKMQIVHGWTPRLLWAIQLDRPGLGQMFLPATWHSLYGKRGLQPMCYPGEPPRCLLFSSHTVAAKWCKSARKLYRCCSDWKFSPVSVMERIEVYDPHYGKRLRRSECMVNSPANKGEER